jgi:hypothetical protein
VTLLPTRRNETGMAVNKTALDYNDGSVPIMEHEPLFHQQPSSRKEQLDE